MILDILKLGWKNVWRNPARSGVVIIAVLLGTWAGIFISAFLNGMAQGYLQDQLTLTVGHIQITNPEFEDQFSPEYAINNSQQLIEELSQKPDMQEIRPQSMTTGLAQSAANSYGVTIHGIRPGDKNPHPVKKYVEHGDFLEDDSRNPIAIGDDLAKQLDLELGSRMVLSFQDVSGSITGGAFRVAGIFDSFSSNYDKSNVIVKMSDLNQLLGQDGMIHQITLMISDFTQANTLARNLAQEFPELHVASWSQVAPALKYVYESMDISMYIIMVIIIIALIFSIVNTMLMAIMERSRELGMLMAIGMNRPRVFSMILSETFFLTMVGAPLGLLLSWGTISLLQETGINLGAFAEGLNAYGMSTIIHPQLSFAYYVTVTLMIAAAALLSALYPAWKTLQLNPVEAIRKI